MPNGCDHTPQHTRRPLRHTVHLYAYAFVSFALMTMGLVFSAFAIFKRDSDISKVWLAGPTTIAVGLVLCGKVIIDCRPRASMDDEEEACGNEEELADMVPSLMAVNSTKGSRVTPDYSHSSLAKDGSLVIENIVTSKRVPCDHCDHRPVRNGIPVTERTIWDVREDGPTQSGSQCLVNSSAGQLRVGGCPLHQSDLSMQRDTAGGPSWNRNAIGERSGSPVSPDQGGTIYQGEVFLVNDKQYFI